MARQMEGKYINEFLAKHYFDKHYETRQWLGLPPMKEFREMYSVTGRWADAIVFEPHQITIIEAKLKPTPEAIGQLLAYEDLFKRTPRFSQYWHLPVRLVLVTTKEDDTVKALCESNGIEYVVFRPKWIEAYEKIRYRLK